MIWGGSLSIICACAGYWLYGCFGTTVGAITGAIIGTIVGFLIVETKEKELDKRAAQYHRKKWDQQAPEENSIEQMNYNQQATEGLDSSEIDGDIEKSLEIKR